MEYEILIFDADETLFDFKKSERDAIKNTMLEFDIEYDEKHHLKIYHDINWGGFNLISNIKIFDVRLKLSMLQRFLKNVLLQSINMNFSSIL